MRRWQLLLALVLAGLCAVAAPAHAYEWLRGESPHFHILARDSRTGLERRIQKLERLHHAMGLALGVTGGQGLNRPPFQMVMKDDENVVASFFPHLRDRASGLFVLSEDGAMAVSTAWLGRDRRDYTGGVLYHEYAHRLMAQYARMHYPVWYVEGFAEYFGASYMDEEFVEIGAASSDQWMLDRQRWLDGQRLLKPSFRSTGEEGIDQRDMGMFYRQSWLLTHYMLADSARTQRFNDYFRRLAAGEDAVAAFEPAIGIPVDKLNAELRSYRDKMYVARLPNNSLPKVEVRITPIPAAEAEAEFDAWIVRANPKADVGKAALQRLRETVVKAGGESAPERMRLALAYAEIRCGDVQRALQLLAPWARREGTAFEANRLLGLAWQAEAERSQGAERSEAMVQASSFLMEAYKQRRNDAPTLYQLARVLLQTKGISPSVINAADAAARYEPQVEDYARLAVSMHLQSGNHGRAADLLQNLADNPHGGEDVERARAALQALRSNQDTADILSLLNGTKKPTTP